MVEVIPKRDPIKVNYWKYLVFLFLLICLLLFLLWGIFGTQWGASNSYGEWFRKHLSTVNRFRPHQKPQDNLSTALRIHGLEKIADGKFALLFSITDSNSEPIITVPANSVSISAGSSQSTLKPAIIDRVVPLALKSNWNDKASFAAVMDYSSSMFPEDIDSIEANYSTFIKGVNYQFKASVVKFHQKVNEIQQLTDDSQKIEAAIKQKEPLGPSTALYDGIEKGITSVQARPHFRFLLLTTDGNDNISNTTLEEVIRMGKLHHISGFVLGFGWTDVDILKRVAEETDGYFVYLPDSGDLKNWFPKIAKIINNVQVAEFSGITGITQPTSLEISVSVNGTQLKRSF